MTDPRTRTVSVLRPGLPLASRWSRFVAWFLDLVLVLLCVIPGFIAAVEGDPTGAYAAVSLACYLGLWVYQAYLRATRGQTIGKKATDIRIVSYDDGSNPGFWRAVFLRDMVPAAISWIFCSFFTVIDNAFIFGRERRCVHDYMAATIVVRTDVDATWDAAEVFD